MGSKTFCPMCFKKLSTIFNSLTSSCNYDIRCYHSRTRNTCTVKISKKKLILSILVCVTLITLCTSNILYYNKIAESLTNLEYYGLVVTTFPISQTILESLLNLKYIHRRLAAYKQMVYFCLSKNCAINISKSKSTNFLKNLIEYTSVFHFFFFVFITACIIQIFPFQTFRFRGILALISEYCMFYGFVELITDLMIYKIVFSQIFEHSKRILRQEASKSGNLLKHVKFLFDFYQFVINSFSRIDRYHSPILFVGLPHTILIEAACVYSTFILYNEEGFFSWSNEILMISVLATISIIATFGALYYIQDILTKVN